MAKKISYIDEPKLTPEQRKRLEDFAELYYRVTVIEPTRRNRRVRRQEF